MSGPLLDTHGNPVEDMAQFTAPTCLWSEDEDGNWHTGCGQTFDLYMGTPSENRMKFCPYCGTGLKEKGYDNGD